MLYHRYLGTPYTATQPEDSLVLDSLLLYFFVPSSTHCCFNSLEDGFPWGGFACDGLTFSVCQVSYATLIGKHWQDMTITISLKVWTEFLAWFFQPRAWEVICHKMLSEQIIYLYGHKWHTFARFWQNLICKHIILKPLFKEGCYGSLKTKI